MDWLEKNLIREASRHPSDILVWNHPVSSGHCDRVYPLLILWGPSLFLIPVEWDGESFWPLIHKDFTLFCSQVTWDSYVILHLFLNSRYPILSPCVRTFNVVNHHYIIEPMTNPRDIHSTEIYILLKLFVTMMREFLRHIKGK